MQVLQLSYLKYPTKQVKHSIKRVYPLFEVSFETFVLNVKPRHNFGCNITMTIKYLITSSTFFEICTIVMISFICLLYIFLSNLYHMSVVLKFL